MPAEPSSTCPVQTSASLAAEPLSFLAASAFQARTRLATRKSPLFQFYSRQTLPILRFPLERLLTPPSGITINIYGSSGNPDNDGKEYVAPGPDVFTC